MYPMYPYQSNIYSQQTNNLLRVNGIEGARAYQMSPNSTIALFDANEDIFYIKSSDAGGFSNVVGYSFKKLEETKPLVNGDFVTRKEFEELKEIVNGKFIVQQPKQYDSDDEPIQSVQTKYNGQRHK